MKKPSIAIIFLTVFIDLIGFGIVLPLLPIYAQDFGASAFVLGALMSSYSLMQFIFAPIWGRISDRVGRRPILLMSTAGSAISYVLFALGSGAEGKTALIVLLVSRSFAGIFAANITVAQAYIADVTPAAERSKRMGLVGMAFGLGFTFGPALGGVGRHWLGMSGPGWIAAGLCAVNFIFAWIRLRESWHPGEEQPPQKPHLEQYLHTLKLPNVLMLVSLFFLATFVYSIFQVTIGLLIGKNFNLSYNDASGHTIDDPRIGYLYTYCGLIGAIVQGVATGRMVKRLGEAALVYLSLILVAISIVLMPYVWPGHFGWTGLLILLAIFSIGSSLTRPPLFGMLSARAPTNEQGATIGVAQSAGSLSRIIAPFVGAQLFYYHSSLPYLVCGVISALTCLYAWRSLRK